MRTTTLLSRAVALATAALLTGGAGMAGAAERPAERPGGERTGGAKPLTVMTRNVYLGADINRPVTAAVTAEAQGLPPQQVVLALAHATHQTRAIVDQTDFTTRAGLLADEIAQTRPQLVGLQEVALWRHGPLDLAHVGVPDATVVDYDYLQLLLDALAARGEVYEPAVVGERADVESPSFTGTGSPDARDVRLTMRDVILVRADSGVEVTGSHDQVYAHNLSVDVGGVTMGFDRGFQWVDARSGGTSYRFVNTHLEAFSTDIAYAQVSELLQSAPAEGRSTVFVCDCNSDPLNNTVKRSIGDTLPHKAPYDLVTQSFTDEWLQWAPASAGWTSGLSELVNDPTPAGFDHRIDMVFGRSASGTALPVDRGEVVGTAPEDRDPATGLWPSDHGGVVLRLRGL